MNSNLILWNDTSSILYKKYDILFKNQVPICGHCKNHDGSINNDMEGLRIVSHVYYNYYNNGQTDYSYDRRDYIKQNINTPVNAFMKRPSYNNYTNNLENSMRKLIKWCWDRNATRQDKYELLYWKRYK